MLTHPLKVFINREDVYAKGFYSETQQKTGYTPTWEHITDEILNKHSSGELAVGAYQLSESNMVTWICFDFDNPDPTMLGHELDRAIILAQYLRDNDINALVEISGSKGYHVWVLLKHPITAKSAILYGKEAQERSKIGNLELFPKQESIGDGVGSLVKLPLGLHPKTKNRSQFVNIDTKTPYTLEESIDLLGDSYYKNNLSEIKLDALKKSATLKNLVRPAKKTETKPCLALKSILDHGVPEGMRDDTRYLITAFAYNNGWSKEETLKVLLEFNQKCEPADTDYNVKYKLEQNWKGLERSPRKVGCKSLGKFSTILKEFCPYRDVDKDEDCEWMNPYDKIEIKHLVPSKLRGKRISIEGMMIKVKFHTRIAARFYECEFADCREPMTSRGLFPDDVPAKIETCMNAATARKEDKGRHKMRLRHDNPEALEDGVIIDVLTPNTLPEKSNIKIRIWCPLSNLKISASMNDDEKYNIIEKECGLIIRARGRLQVEHIMINNKIKQTIYWLLADEIKKSQLSLYELQLTEEDKDSFKKLFAKNLDLETIDKMFAPNIIGLARLKRDILLTLFTPLEIREGFGVGRLMLIGDPETAKSTICRQLFDEMLEQIGALMITAERMSQAGFVGGVTREQDGSFTIDWGVITFVHTKALCIDGIHQFSKTTWASTREVVETHKVTIVKVVVGTRPSATRIIAISNTNDCPIKKNYKTKYEASFDLGTGADWDQEDKFSGADRRRWHIIRVLSKEDVNTCDIDNHLAKESREVYADQDTLQKFIAWCWSLKRQDFDFDALNILNSQILNIIREWKLAYPDIELAILGNKAYPIFAAYVLSSATIHYRVTEEGKVKPSQEDVDYIKQMFEDMFAELEINKVMEDRKIENDLITKISVALSPEVKKLIELFGSEIAETFVDASAQLGKGRSTLYRELSDELILSFGPNTIRYSLTDGCLTPGFRQIEPIFSRNNLTEFGRKIYKHLKISKSQTQTTLDDPGKAFKG